MDIITSGCISSLPGKLTCRLLSLPAELRNCIYDYCIEPEPIIFPETRTEFGNLRYACRALYNEFAPVYLANTIIVVEPSRIERYLSALYPKTRSSRDVVLTGVATAASSLPSNIYGILFIDFRFDAVLDLTPLARLKSRVPKMEIEIFHDTLDPEKVEYAEQFIDRITACSCLLDFEQTVERIFFRYNNVVVKLHLGVLFRDLSPHIRYKPFLPCFESGPQDWLSQQNIWAIGFKVVMEDYEGVWRNIPWIHPRSRLRFRKPLTAGRRRFYKRTPSMEALMNGMLPPTSHHHILYQALMYRCIQEETTEDDY